MMKVILQAYAYSVELLSKETFVKQIIHLLHSLKDENVEKELEQTFREIHRQTFHNLHGDEFMLREL